MQIGIFNPGVSRPAVAAALNSQRRASPPAYVDTFSSVRSIPSVPDNIATYQSSAGGPNQYTLTVTGSPGGKSVVAAETAVASGSGTGFWPCAVEYADGSLDFNVVRGRSGQTFDLQFPLRLAPAYISPVWDAALGQHMTRRGYRAYADMIYRQQAMFCTAKRYLGGGAFALQPASIQTFWTRNAALTSYGAVNVNNLVSGLVVDSGPGNYALNGRLVRSSWEACGVSVTCHAIGHGAIGSFSVSGRRVFVELFAVCVSGGTTPTAFGSAVVNVYATTGGYEQLVYSKSIGDFMERLLVPVDEADSIRIEALSTAAYPFVLRLMDTRCWEATGSGPLIDKNAKIVTLGDSWFEYYSTKDSFVSLTNGAFSERLQEVMRADGGTGSVVNKARGGMTTRWALAWFDQYVLPERPSQCILHFFTNDANPTELPSFVGPDGQTWTNTVATSDEWRANIAALSSKCQQHGIQPIVILPTGTASISQGQTQLQWRRQIRRGLLDDEVSKPYVTERTNPLSNRIALLEAQIYDFRPFDRNVAAIGTDSNADGLSNGVTIQTYGTNTGTTTSTTIDADVQLITAGYTQSGSTGGARLRFDFSLTAGRDYFLLVQFDKCSPSTRIFMVSTLYGTADDPANGVVVNTDSDGKRMFYRRFNAATNTSSYFSALVKGSIVSVPVTYVTGIARVNIIDLTSMDQALGLTSSTYSDADLFNLIVGSMTRLGA